MHKDSVFACILDEQGKKIFKKHYRTLTPDLTELRDTLEEKGCGRVAMESTSIYWIPIWHVLESDFELTLANPNFIWQLPGRKSDVKDAQWIAECFQKGLIKSSFVVDGVLRQMRQYARYLQLPRDTWAVLQMRKKLSENFVLGKIRFFVYLCIS